MTRSSRERATRALYTAAREFTRDRDTFAPGQFTDFIPRKGTQHYAEHKALADAARKYAEAITSKERDSLSHLAKKAPRKAPRKALRQKSL